jgi:hypothetical protein
MGKGTEHDNRMRDRIAERRAAIARGEYPPNYHPRPELRLRADTPSIDANGEISAQDLLSHITPREYGVALRDPDGTVRAMVVPLDRYIELASGTIAGDDHTEIDQTEAVPGGMRPRVQARPASLEALNVEQIDPQAEWWPGSSPRQHLGNPNRPPE